MDCVSEVVLVLEVPLRIVVPDVLLSAVPLLAALAADILIDWEESRRDEIMARKIVARLGDGVRRSPGS